ncbi:hypothetical protein NUU61_007270 [Penicillium alfredii]|uniref:Uncharacterized protein n=1 Tax=Penicillium alfredii TaxID=1506179 RepID=A0A9W9K4E3_9EURO|nr:uncharacterized protein NUU61_007270 [Penicillium alfredii]KAJ5092400.1 hypothetical protein NUU61_007270 [Penicillium alfredii]
MDPMDTEISEPEESWKSDPKDGPEPICLLCAVAVPTVEQLVEIGKGDPETAVYDEDQWQHYRDTQQDYVMVPSQEVETAYFYQRPRLWSAFCRATNGTRFLVLTDIEYGEADPNWEAVRRIAYQVHAHCWALFDRVVDGGISRIESNYLAELVQAARRLWDDDICLWNISDWWVLLGTCPNSLSFRVYPQDLYLNPLVLPDTREAIDRSQKLAIIQQAKREHLDWQTLGIDLISIIVNEYWYISSGLANRERILGLMRKINSNLLE